MIIIKEQFVNSIHYNFEATDNVFPNKLFNTLKMIFENTVKAICDCA